MHQLNVLKEIIKKIDNVGVEDQQAQQAIINKLEEFTSNYKKEIIKGNGLDSIEKESDRALLNKINSDLLTLFQDSNKNHEFCFEVIKYLSPIIGIKKFFLNWWSIVVTKWLFQDLNNENGNDIIKLILEFLFIETAEDSECPAILYILEFYIVNHQSYSKNESNTQVYNNDVSLLKVQQTSSLSQLDNLYSNLNKIILEYGIVKTKEFYHSCNVLYRYTIYRIIVTDILINFISEKSDYSHEIINTELLKNMYLSLIFDKSWLLFQLNLTIISMILPYIIKELKEHLVIVLLVILRHSISVNNQLMPLFDNSLTEGITFNIIVDETKFDNNKRIKDLFSLILFLFPYNFINFIKQPKEYLYSHIDIIRSYFQLDNNKEVTLNQIFDQKSFQHDMNSILEEHTFPSSYLFGDLNDELSDENSSFLIEPIEIISKSLILQPNPSSEHIQINGNSILDSSDLFSEQFINLKYEIINNKNKNDKKDDSVQEGEDLVSKKKEIILNENLLLRGELLFETYLCQHQSQYIRKLHRDRILESSTEAERHSLYSTCKTLRNEVKVLKELMERQRVESSASQSKHITWENELNKKVKYYRELCRELKVKNEILAKEMEELKVGDNANTKILQNLEFKENCLNGLSSAIDELKSELKNKEVQIQKLTEKIIQWEIEDKSIKGSKEDENE